MGTIQHHAVIATTPFRDKFKEVWKRTKEMEGHFVKGKAQINGYRTIVLMPDGSKEGWIVSNAGDEARDAFIALLESYALDGGNYWDYVEVSWGEMGSHTPRGSDLEALN